jgi:hypothetical protein
MDPWLILSWVVAISLIVIVTSVTAIFFVSIVFAFVKPKRKSKDGWAPASVSIFQGTGE